MGSKTTTRSHQKVIFLLELARRRICFLITSDSSIQLKESWDMGIVR